VSGRLSVRPSRWCIVSRRLNILYNFFLSPVAPHHSSFFTPSADTQFQGEPVSGGAKYTECENFSILNHRFSRKRYEIGPCITIWNVTRKLYIGGGSIRVGPRWPWETLKGGTHFYADLFNNSPVLFDLEQPNSAG